MKKTLLTVICLCAMTTSALAAVTFGITSLDKEYTLHTKCSGSSKTTTLRASTTTSVTIQGSGPCKIEYGKGGVASGNLTELSGGEKITIKDGKLSKK
jgi:hypothetical protein